ncbi:unnamed protein product [Rotaria socialis]|uniref:Uncharacterized protein n=1 Tax=Rotaria socialis TaxID=392032 RepID=A0A820VMT5_9BILA|nr:unnamed protein product [Rotaria socialis]CAF3568890.1 unnamed protein product [Rotaria socialis]CAF4502563.1 unnamed protein product [Rotaria socialis]CAF4740564.1 unnamed protein product [Rotaria socialis]
MCNSRKYRPESPIKVDPTVEVPSPQPPTYVSPATEMERHISALEALLSVFPDVVTPEMRARLQTLADRMAQKRPSSPPCS